MPAASTETLTAATPRVATTCEAARAAVVAARQRGQTVGLVPTMGALHEGHLSLVRAARRTCDYVVVTIFVNPTQFGPGEDFARYPRSWETDLAACGREGVDLVFAPSDEEMYAPDHSVFVEPGDVARPLEGECRPGHFRGVATVVLKLFGAVPADVAFFGQKDYQQTLVIRRMVRELNVPIEIRVRPTVREPDGLALSSRNAYLSADERRRALGIVRALGAAARLVAGGERQAEPIREQMNAVLAEAGIEREQIDYVALADPDTLDPVEAVDAQTVALVAARVGSTRLIDNHVLGQPPPDGGA